MFNVTLGDSVFLTTSTQRSPEGSFPHSRVPQSGVLTPASSKNFIREASLEDK